MESTVPSVSERGHAWIRQSTAGALGADRFLRTHWQRKLWFARAALTGFAERFEPAQLLELAVHDDVESRLVLRNGSGFRVEHGPFTKKALRRLPREGWSLLVQGADLHLPSARALMNRFDFIPYARQDDVMLSLSPAGGGVGAHFDSYDVFLVQARGRRRWRIGRQKELALVPSAPLRLLRSFRPQHEIVVEPGDVLYLPPRYAHEGVALSDECITCSIGFRAPSRQEIVTSFLQWLPETLALSGRYRDRDAQRPRHPAEIGQGMVREIEAMLSAIRWPRGSVERFIGEHWTEPKAHVWFRAPAKALSFARFLDHARARGVRLAAATRMLFRRDRVFINGDSVQVPAAARKPLIALADERAALPWRSRSREATRHVYEWYRAGYVELV
jgi:50S ribosomal protein L16 3-hydroxylase